GVRLRELLTRLPATLVSREVSDGDRGFESLPQRFTWELGGELSANGHCHVQQRRKRTGLIRFPVRSCNSVASSSRDGRADRQRNCQQEAARSDAETRRERLL